MTAQEKFEMADEVTITKWWHEIGQELQRATAKFPHFHSAHEGFAVLLEEVDELWEAVRCQDGPTRTQAMRSEAIQVAAMALRFLIDVADKE